MIRKSPLMLWALLVGVVLLLSLTGRNVAQETAPPSTDAASSTDADAPDAEEKFRERTIYIPYEDLRRTFEREGRGVFLPYDQFRALWDAARSVEQKEDPARPPVGALITETENTASVEKDVVQVAATVSIELLDKGWHEVPLRLPNAAITKATIDGEPARVVKDPSGAGYKLLVEKKDDKAERIELLLEYAKAIQRSPGHNSVAFDAPQAPVSRWTVRVPESGVKVDFFPLIAASEVEDKKAEGETPVEGEDETVVLAFVGAAPTVRIGWTPKAEGATGLEALATVQAQQQIAVDAGVVRTQARLDYAISRAELSKLAVEVPADQRVVNVFDANIRKWTVNQGDDVQTIDIDLFEPAKEKQTIVLELEKFSDKAEDEAEQTGPIAVAAPVVKALGVGRQQGVVVVRVGEGLTAEADKATGLLQIDKSELPQALAQQPWDFAYRYAAVPFMLDLAVEKVQPRITVDSLVEAKLSQDRVRLDVYAIYMIERAGVFQVEYDIPDGYDILGVSGHSISGVNGMGVETHHAEAIADGEGKRLTVNLSRKAIGRSGLRIMLQKKLDEPDLLTPTGKTVRIDLPIPQAPNDAVERASGRLVVTAPESLRVNPVDLVGLQNVSYEEAMQGMADNQIKSVPESATSYMFADEPTSLALDVERRKPYVTVDQMLGAKIEDGVVKYTATFHCNVRYSGVRTIRIDIPSEVSAIVRNDTSPIRDAVMSPPPEDVEEGMVAWQFSGETELLGAFPITLSWEKKLEQLAVGGSVDIVIPRLVPAEVDRTQGDIVLSKAETIDLHEAEESTGLRPIDAQHELLHGAEPGAAAAFRFQGPWELTIRATRYELAEIKHTSIERALLRAVVHRSGGSHADSITVQALYRIRSARQRIQMALPTGSKITKSQIDGVPIILETEKTEAGEQYYIPLVDTTPETPILFELQYSQPNFGNGEAEEPPTSALTFEYPTFPLEPAMQQVYLCVYLPEEWDVLSTDGPWTQEFTWRWDEDRGEYDPYNQPDDTYLLHDWVGADTPGRASAIESAAMFPVDGTVYVFSALQPGDPSENALKLATVRQSVLDGVVLAIIILVGALLLPMRCTYRILAAAAVAVLLVLLNVFEPILTHQIADRTLFWAVVIVLVIWLVKFLAWTLPRKAKTWCACMNTGEATTCKAPSASPFGEAKADATSNPYGEPATSATSDDQGESPPRVDIFSDEEKPSSDDKNSDDEKGGSNDA